MPDARDEGVIVPAVGAGCVGSRELGLPREDNLASVAVSGQLPSAGEQLNLIKADAGIVSRWWIFAAEAARSSTLQGCRWFKSKTSQQAGSVYSAKQPQSAEDCQNAL